MDIDVEEYAKFQAFQAAEAARKNQRVAAQWVQWAAEVGGDPAGILRARDMAVELIAQHAPGWELKFSNARKRDGSVHYEQAPGTRVWDGKPGKIILSGPLMSLWTEKQQRTVILHEIAHAKAPEDGHGSLWGWHCAQLGIEPRRCWGSEEFQRAPVAASRRPPPRPWVGTCQGGHEHKPRTRKPKARYSCSVCSPGRFDENYLVTWEKKS